MTVFNLEIFTRNPDAMRTYILRPGTKAGIAFSENPVVPMELANTVRREVSRYLTNNPTASITGDTLDAIVDKLMGGLKRSTTGVAQPVAVPEGFVDEALRNPAALRPSAQPTTRNPSSNGNGASNGAGHGAIDPSIKPPLSNPTPNPADAVNGNGQNGSRIHGGGPRVGPEAPKGRPKNPVPPYSDKTEHDPIELPKQGNWAMRQVKANFATSSADFKNIYTTETGVLNKGRLAIAVTGTAVGLGVSYHFLKKAAKGTKVDAATGLEVPQTFVQRTGNVIAGLGGLVGAFASAAYTGKAR